MSKLIIGRGGGKSGGSGTEAPNTLKSQSFANVLDLLCEGEIEGFYHGNERGEEDIYLDGVPLKESDGSYNFTDFSYDLLEGTQHQNGLKNFPIQSGTSYDVIVKKDRPTTQTVFNTKVLDAIKVVVSVDSLVESNKDTGDIYGHFVNYRISLRTQYSGWVTRVEDSIVGKTLSKYNKAVTIDIPEEYQGKHIYVRLERLSADDIDDEESDIKQKSTFRLRQIFAITYDKLTYPNSAIFALNINSEYFANVPARSYDLKLLKIKVPSSNFYSPESRTYHKPNGQLWDGSFDVAWSDNPAWCFYDLLTNSRYGLGKYISPDMIDVWELFRIAQYCDELVPDGFGTWEPRYTCNMLITSRKEALSVVKDMTKIFRGMAYWSGNVLSFTYDHPESPEMLFTNANVVDGSFSYSGSQLSARKSVALVTWNDPSEGYSRVVEYVEDHDALLKYGYKEISLNAIGCTSRAQARRLGKWVLYSENHEGNLLGFSAGNIGASLRPGSIIQIADSTKVSSRLGGRVVSSTFNTVELDSEISVPVGSFILVEVKKLVVETLPDDTTLSPSKVERHINAIEEKEVLKVDGNVVTVAPVFDDVYPAPNSLWVARIPALVEPATFKVLSIVENTDSGVYDVSAIKHSAEKYDYVERDIPFEEKKTSNLSLSPKSITDFTKMLIEESLYVVAGTVYNKVQFDWPDVEGAVSYSVHYKIGNNNWTLLDRECPTSYIELLNAPTGSYTFKVSTRNSFNRSSPAVESAVVKVLGKTAPPANVKNFKYAMSKTGVVLSWDPVTDLDLHGYELRYGTGWENSVAIDLLTANRAVITIEEYNVDKDFLIRSIDTSGNLSKVASRVHVILPSVPRVLGFSCVQALGRLDFAWRPSPDPYLTGYEIREGDLWEQSTLVSVVNSTTYSVPYGGRGTRKFLIKALNSLGSKSDKASFTTTEIAQPKDMNAIYSQNELTGLRSFESTPETPAGQWAGVKIDLVVDSGKLVSEFGKLSGEYLTEVTLPDVYTAQNTVVSKKNVVKQDLETWNTATFSWYSTESLRPWLIEFVDSIGDVRMEIAYSTPKPASEVQSWRFHDTTTSINGLAPEPPPVAVFPGETAPVNANTFAGLPARGRFSSGLLRTGVDPLEYTNVDIPKEFSMIFWVRPTASVESFEVIRLEGLAGSFLQLTYDYTQQKFILTPLLSGVSNPAEHILEVSYEIVPDALLAVGISQSSSVRRLFIANMQANDSVMSAKSIPPPTNSGYNLLKVS